MNRKPRISPIEVQLTQTHGELHTVIPVLVSLHGQTKAAELLGVPQDWVSRWLKRNGYRPVTKWERASA